LKIFFVQVLFLALKTDWYDRVPLVFSSGLQVVTAEWAVCYFPEVMDGLTVQQRCVVEIGLTELL